jgi:GTP-binding protein
VFSVIDTGGYAVGSEDIFEGEIRRQVDLAIEEATVIIFMVDVMSGIVEMDELVAKKLRKSGKPVIVAANKVDNTQRIGLSAEFYSFGLGDVFDLSATNGTGTGEILDAIVPFFNFDEDISREEDSLPKIAVVGRPNVGKSSLINALTGEERNIVTNISGTTRDAIHTRYKSFGFDFVLIDTAGIRKKTKVHEDIEYYSVLRSIRTIENADVCIVMLDASEGLQKQDLSIYYIAEKNSKGIVVLVNKWDLVEKDHTTMKAYEAKLREELAPFNDVPIIFTSVLTKQRIYQAIEAAIRVNENRTKKISTSVMNDVLLPIIHATPPAAVKGKYIKIKYVQQLPTYAPAFAIFCNLPQYVQDSYKRFIENKLRKEFDFEGVPIKVFFRKK